MSLRTPLGFFILVPLLLLLAVGASAADRPLSEATEYCLDCHRTATPALTADWEASVHARITPTEGMTKSGYARKVTAREVPNRVADVVVGCAECHTLNPDKHPDSFDHGDEQVHPVVTPGDCAVCHPQEVEQYQDNKMSQAYGNLMDNELYVSLVEVINGNWVYRKDSLVVEPPAKNANADSCLTCHGTVLEVVGTKPMETDFGEMDFPVIEGWPNQGVGRVNPDRTLGSCASCHTRHLFSIKTARQPYTCSQCHTGPDVPAYKIYSVSKHGNLFSSHKSEWDFAAVPWTVGRDFSAPTCAACHVSLVVDQEGELVAERTHRMNDRLPWRLFGLVYAHPQPKSAQTSLIRNQAGLQLPTEFNGEPAEEYLIGPEEMEKRTQVMKGVCQACHSQTWTDGHWAGLERTIKYADGMVHSTTRLMTAAWQKKAAQGPKGGSSPFNEALERKWVEGWLFYANSVRLAAAMGGVDYGVFDNGRWQLSRNLQEMADWFQFLTSSQKKGD